MADLSLSDALRHLRSELTKAQAEAEPNDIRFDMREIELELQMVARAVTAVDATAEASGSIWSVVTAKVGGSASHSSSEDQTHRIKLTMGLAPKEDGKPHQISGEGKEPS